MRLIYKHSGYKRYLELCVRRLLHAISWLQQNALSLAC